LHLLSTTAIVHDQFKDNMLHRTGQRFKHLRKPTTKRDMDRKPENAQISKW